MRFLLLLFVCLMAFAQTPYNIQFGGLACAAVRRPENRVQTYCYLYPPSSTWKLVHNAITDLRSGILTAESGLTALVGGVRVRYASCNPVEVTEQGGECLCLDGISWHFVLLENGDVKFNVAMAHNGTSMEDSGVTGLILGDLPQ